jgi:hypothetical protein
MGVCGTCECLMRVAVLPRRNRDEVHGLGDVDGLPVHPGSQVDDDPHPVVTPRCRPAVSPDGVRNRRWCRWNPNFSWKKGAGNNFCYEIYGSSLDRAGCYIACGSHTTTWALQPNTRTMAHWAYIIVVFKLNQCHVPSFSRSHCQCYTSSCRHRLAPKTQHQGTC